MKKLNIAVIGAGRLGGFHAEKIIGLPHVELVAVVDPVAANRNRVAAECNTQALAEPSSLLGKSTPPSSPPPPSCTTTWPWNSCEAGVHLLVEKPLWPPPWPRPTNWSRPPAATTASSRSATSSVSIRP